MGKKNEEIKKEKERKEGTKEQRNEGRKEGRKSPEAGGMTPTCKPSTQQAEVGRLCGPGQPGPNSSTPSPRGEKQTANKQSKTTHAILQQWERVMRKRNHGRQRADYSLHPEMALCLQLSLAVRSIEKECIQ